VIIFDLDGTVIDSSHRQLIAENGALDLAHWKENSTPEKIAADSLLPLAKFWRVAQNTGFPIIVCTARVMGPADYAFLESHGLRYNVCLSRREGDTTPDAALKILVLKGYARKLGITWAHFCARATAYDDNAQVLKAYSDNRITAYHPKDLAA